MHQLRALALCGITAIAALTTACDSTTTSPGATTAPAATSAPAGGPAVSISGSTFQPALISIHVGDTVTWTNKDGFPHTATSDASAPAPFDSHELNEGGTFPFTFAVAGNYTYHCSIHASMTGAITVR